MWQNGSDTRRFIMTCPMFSSTKYRRRVEPPYKVHHWITDALKDSKDWFPNPDRTTYLHYDKGELKDISEFEPGDVVWVSFTMTYSVGPKAWGPEFRPIEMIKVGTAFRELDDIPSVSRARLELGPVDLPMTGKSSSAVCDASLTTVQIWNTELSISPQTRRSITRQIKPHLHQLQKSCQRTPSTKSIRRIVT